MHKHLSKENSAKFWPHQAKAISFAVNHLRSEDKPCLIRMPTGTGKTGVIAGLSMLSTDDTTLILTPWVHLREQMVEDLKTKFWKKVGISPGKFQVSEMLPSKAANIIAEKGAKVIIATFQTLNDIRRTREGDYKSLKEAIGTVIVDECHYEPAVEWGKSVKGLKAKTVLLTATPYRNDLKLFRISDIKKSTQHYTHEQAVKDEIIRKLKVESLETDSNSTFSSCVKQFLKKWRQAQNENALPVNNPRAIVCCGDASEIQWAVEYLNKQGEKAIGVHENFKTDPVKNLYKAVPEPSSNNASIWIHQYKLTEGLDENRFCFIAVLSKIRSDRRLIQQIGRVLRKSQEEKGNKPAVLMAPDFYDIERRWANYLAFETKLDLLEPAHFKKVVNDLLESQPEVEYFDGRFRRRFVPNNKGHRFEVLIPPSVKVFQLSDNFLLKDYIEDCTDTLNTEDAVILGEKENAPVLFDENMAFWIYASIRNSRYLNSTSLYEVRLESHCIVVKEGLALVSDSRGIIPREYMSKNTNGSPSKLLHKYLDEDFRPTSVSVDSSIPYDTVIRGIDTRGHNLLNVPTSLTDRLHICRSARGVSTEKGRRYVGITRGRLTKSVSKDELLTFDIKTFEKWANSVIELLSDDSVSSPLFDRYMAIIDPPAKVEPVTASVDFLRTDIHFKDSNDTEYLVGVQSVELTSSDEASKKDTKAITCKKYAEFKFVKKGSSELASVLLEVSYSNEKSKFTFKKVDGKSLYVTLDKDDDRKAKTLGEFLSSRQDLLLIGLEGGEAVYQGGNFYQIDYSYAENTLLGLIERPKNGASIKNEKGTEEQISKLKKSGGTTFPAGSLFRAIKDEVIGLPFKPDVLICDDMGTECADFVAINFETPSLALIHAKVGSGTKVSASAFHDVVAQAMKNLVYFTRGNDIPNGVKQWNPQGKWNKTSIPRLYADKEIKEVNEKLWERIKQQILGAPDPRLFVVLATSGCCDAMELKEAASKTENRTAQVAQLFHLLDGLSGHAKQLGVRVKILDLPYKTS